MSSKNRVALAAGAVSLCVGLAVGGIAMSATENHIVSVDPPVQMERPRPPIAAAATDLRRSKHGYQSVGTEKSAVTDTPDDFESNLLALYAASSPDASHEVAIRALVNGGISETFGSDFKYSVECRDVACVISAESRNVDGAGLCDVVPYKTEWSLPIWCPAQSNRVYLFRTEPSVR